MVEFTISRRSDGKLKVKIEGKGIELISLLRDAACEEPLLTEIYRLAAEDAECVMKELEPSTESSYDSYRMLVL